MPAHSLTVPYLRFKALRWAWGLLLGLPLATSAQKIELGAGLGGALYKGDVAPRYNPRFVRPSVSGFFRYNLSKSVSLRAQATLGQVLADDRFSPDPFLRQRGVSFRNRIREASLDVQYNFLNYSMLPKAVNWSPYVFGGLGVTDYGLKPPGGMSLGDRLVVPLGVGLKYEFKRPWSVSVEWATRFTGYDMLDGYVDGPITSKFTQSNPALPDQFSTLTVSVSYTFYKIVCP